MHKLTFLLFALIVSIMSLFVAPDTLADVANRDSLLLNPLTVSTSARADFPNLAARPIWVDSTTVYFVNYASSGITIYGSEDAGVTWTSLGSATSSNIVNALAVWWDGWTIDDPGNLIHILWSTHNGTGTGTLNYRKFSVTSNTFPTAAVQIFSQFDANSFNGPDRNYVELTRNNSTLFAAMYFRSARYFRSSTDNGVTWSAALSVTDMCPNAAGNSRSQLVFDPNDTNLIWQFCKTSTTNLSFRSYNVSGNTWTIVQDETVIAAGTTFYQPVDVTLCRNVIYVVASGNEGTLHSSNHAEFFRVVSTGSITALGDSLPGSSSRFYGGPSSIVCNGNNNTLFQFVAWKPTALNGSGTYADNVVYPYQYYVRHKIMPFGGWSAFIAINEPSQDSPVYLVDGTSNLNPIRVMTQLAISQGDSQRVLPIWRINPASTEWAVNYNKSLVIGPASVIVTPDTDTIADKLRTMLAGMGLKDIYGYLLFAIVTTLALSVILVLVHTPFILTGIIATIWFSGVIMVLAPVFGGLIFAVLLLVGALIVFTIIRNNGRSVESE